MRRALMLTAVLALVLTACSGGATPPPTDARPSVAPNGDAAESPTPVAAMVIGTCTVEPKTSCPGANLTTAPLSGVDLRGADLSGANLFGADLRGVVLRDADLSDADMRNTDLTGADVVGATLKGANLRDANLFQADFERSDLTNAQIKRSLRCQTILPNGRQDDSGCGDAPVSPPPPSGNPPKITRFSMPSTASCADDDSDVSVRARFAVANAKEIRFEINGEALSGNQSFEADDTSARLEFRCERSRNTYTLVATDGKGGSATERVTVKRG